MIFNAVGKRSIAVTLYWWMGFEARWISCQIVNHRVIIIRLLFCQDQESCHTIVGHAIINRIIAAPEVSTPETSPLFIYVAILAIEIS